MELFVLYITKSVICLTVLYLIYWCFLRKDTFFAVNRIYLISSIFLSLAVPILNFNINTSDVSENYSYILNTITVTNDNLLNTYSQNLSILQMVLIVYFTGAALFLLRFLLQLFQLSRLIKRFGITNKEGLHIVFTDSNFAPFSFFNLMFLNKNIQTSDAEKIIAHEQIHVKQRHSFDVFILELVTIFQWFNPVIWLYRYSLKEVHEYLADEGVLLKGYEKVNYQQLLLSMTLGVPVSDLANNFNTSLIKKRFIMMTKMKSSLPARFKILLVVPFIAAFLVVFACSNKDNSENKGAQSDSVALIPPPPPPPDALSETDLTDEKVFNVVEVMPVFKGGNEAMGEFIMNNVKYPENAKKNGKTGKVFVSFVVNTTGKVCNVKVAKAVDPELDAEAVRCVSSMPDWTPGKEKGEAVNVQFTLPINFQLK